MTPGYALDREPKALDRPVLVNCLYGIGTAGGGEPARWGQHGGDARAVKIDGNEDETLQLINNQSVINEGMLSLQGRGAILGEFKP